MNDGESVILKPQPGPQERFLATNADIAIYGGSAGGGKAQPLDEPVLTPFGFRPMGSLKVGSKVIGADGSAATVIQVHPQGVIPVYKVRFIDGAETRVSGEHLWKYHEARKKIDWRICDTLTLQKMIEQGKNILIPLVDEVHITCRKRGGVIAPYTMGVILGDGCTCGPMITITGNDKEVFDFVRQDGYVLNQCKNDNEDTLLYSFPGFKEEKRYLTMMNLRCKSEYKYVPDGYKHGTIEERYAIIQGLMDTDGYADNRGHCEFCSISKRLAEDMQWLIRSIGGKATITEKTPVCVFPDGTKKECSTAYIVYIQTKDNSKLFRLSRKKERCAGKLFNGGYSELKRRVISVEPCGAEECQCITIDKPDGLYVTKDFIVTHNSYAMLLTPLRYIDVPGFGGTIFRKNYNQIFSQGGLWEEAQKMYSGIEGAEVRKGDGSWIFNIPGGGQSKVSFAHIERTEDLASWQGSQICFIGFDELVHFNRNIFFYMLSRNRSTCGVRPFVRATCNPDANSWVAEFIDWWIDQDTGYPIKERSGKIRWMLRRDDNIFWADKRSELWKQFNLTTPEEKEEPKSVTFISSSIYDNKELLRVNPSYLANLKALSIVERERLLYGNWKIKPAAGMYFKKSQLGNVLEVIPNDVVMWVRCWDLAATPETENGEAAYTAGVLMGKRKNGRYIVADVVNKRMEAAEVRSTIRLTAQEDRIKYKRVRVRVPQDPGQAGKEQAQSYIKLLSGFDVTAVPESGSKESRAEPMAAQWQAGNFDIIHADWNDSYLEQLEQFPEFKFKDMVDASANAFAELELKAQFNISNLL